jgi:hypothetical protein
MFASDSIDIFQEKQEIPQIESSGHSGEAGCPASFGESEIIDISMAGPLGNTPATNRHITISSSLLPLTPPPTLPLTPSPKIIKQLPGGLDTLEVRINGCWEPRKWETIRPQLEAAQTRAETEGPQSIQLAEGDVITVSQHSIRRGDGYYKWKISYENCNILIKDQPTYNERYPNVIIEIGSIVLMDHGHHEAWNMMLSMLGMVGFRISETHVSRVDLCVDLPNVSVSEFVTPFINDWCLKRARKWHVHGEGKFKDTTGFSVGTDIHLRVYDKLTEVKDDLYKLGVMIARRWGGKKPETATRVEFQIRREPLKNQFHVDSVDDLFKRLPDMAAWLTSQWFRLTQGEPDRDNRNESRATTSSLWEHVCDLFTYWAGNMQILLAPRKRGKPNTERLAKQAIGCITSIMAVTGKCASTINDLMLDVAGELNHAVMKSSKLLETVILGKREKLRARVGSTTIAIDPADIPF